MAILRRLEREEWFEYFTTFTRRFLTDPNPESAEIEIVSPDLGDQVAGSGIRVIGITYDPRTNSLEFAFPEGTHRIRNPSELWIHEDDKGFVGLILAVREDGLREIVRLRSVGIVPRHQ